MGAPAYIKNTRMDVPSEKYRKHRRLQDERLANRPGYVVHRLHTEYNTKMPSSDELRDMAISFKEEFGIWPSKYYHRGSTMVTYTGFHVLPGVYLGLDVVQGDGGMG